MNNKEFGALNPNKRIPLIDDDGFILTERYCTSLALPLGGQSVHSSLHAVLFTMLLTVWQEVHRLSTCK